MKLAVILKELNNGRYLLSTRVVGKAVGKNEFREGQAVLTSVATDGATIIHGVLSKKPMPILDLGATAPAVKTLIVCWVGITTGDYEQRFYELVKADDNSYSVQAVDEHGWNLIDDGQYGLYWDYYVDPYDPWAFRYTKQGNGLNIPCINNGISPKKYESSNSARYILSQTMEHEHFQKQQAQFGTVLFDGYYRLKDSAMAYFYSHDYKRPGYMFYRENDVIRMGSVWSGIEGGILVEKGVESSHYRDNVNLIKNIYKVPLDGSVKSTFPVSHLFVDEGLGEEGTEACSDNGYLVLGCRREKYNSQELRLLRMTQRITSNIYSEGARHCICEPEQQERYSLVNGSSILPEGTVGRGATSGEEAEDYYHHLGVRMSFYSGSSIVPNPAEIVYLPFSSCEGETEDQLDTVKIERKTDWSQMKSSLIINGQEIETSDWEDVYVLPQQYPYWDDIPMRKTSFSIMQTFHDSNFHAALYRKTTIQSAQDIPSMPVEIYEGGDETTIPAMQVISKTEFKVCVNGVTSLLPYSITNREYIAKTVGLHYNWPYPWGDVGYDWDGSVAGEENSIVMRECFNSTNEVLVVNYDVYPVRFRNKLQQKSGWLWPFTAPVADTESLPYPAYTDYVYESPTARHWLVFNKDGALLSDITSNIPMDNRLNGMAVLDTGDFAAQQQSQTLL